MTNSVYTKTNRDDFMYVPVLWSCNKQWRRQNDNWGGEYSYMCVLLN